MSRRAVPLALLASVAACAGAAARRASLGWGSLPDERSRPLPGDEVVRYPDLVATRGITIDAKCSQVWPWVVQIGQGRGGFYSYDRLEDLARLGIRSADRIMPEHQHLVVGDTVHLAEQVPLVATTVDAGTALVLSATSTGPQVSTDPTPAARPAMPYEFSWAFVLVPVDDRSCRLVVRERYGYTAPWVALLVEPVEWVSLLMTQKMLRGIRDRAEARAPEPSVSAGGRDATR
ncbi:SRPBCC family protein [Sanguibacter sp. 4.1]|uniref:SRPBCC family protein n=1 Tax=Sanguibacter biliveldensis TaxID=3030830 RepID=A0AAF1BWP1_9MICO|nr:SRPBCC family protein [Sanguibacter sp. 4.1]WPF80851.1 SRPBCC family protein [Sanguibacter sp. 4.1]